MLHSRNLIVVIFSATLRSKGGGGLCDTPGACLRAHACAHMHGRMHAHGQNVQFLRLGQFLINYKGWRLHTLHTLTSGEDQQKPVNPICC